MNYHLVRRAMSCVVFFNLGFTALSFGFSRSTIGASYSDEAKRGGWVLALDENEEAHGVYESLTTTPNCDSTGRCWKRIQFSNGFYISALKFTFVSLGHNKTIHSLEMGQQIPTLAEFSKLTFPLYLKFTDRADQDLLIRSLEGVRHGVELLVNRIRIYCNDSGPVQACYIHASNLNYASVSLGKRGIDLETVQRGSGVGTSINPSWNVSIVGGAADRLYDAMLGNGGPHQIKKTQLTPKISLNCLKRPRASDPYTVCRLSVADESKTAFTLPMPLSEKFANTGLFADAFTYRSDFGMLSIECIGKGSDTCFVRIF